MKPNFRRGTARSGRVPVGLLFVWTVGLLAVVAVGTILWEMRTSTLQSRWFTSIAAEVDFEVDQGPSTEIVFPGSAPYDDRLGYSRLPELIQRASERGFEVVEQARVSERSLQLVREWGLFPVYREKTSAGLSVLDRRGDDLFRVRYPERTYADFESIPPVMWRTLLFVENRSLLDPTQPLKNPAVEWPRLLRSTADLGLRALGREGSIAGASTLATQIEKFRHSPDGLTSSPRDKLTQMGTASLRAYLDGAETIEARRRVVLDYLNSVPLAAQPGEGEITGIGDGMWAWYGRELEEVNRVLGSSDRLSLIETSPQHGSEESAEADGPSTATSDPSDDADLGTIYREVLSLMLSQRRPTYYLARAAGREALQNLTDRHLTILGEVGVISPELARASLAARTEPRSRPPERAPVSFVERKAANAVRGQLLGLLGLPGLYDLDRLDLNVRTAVDGSAQQSATDFIVSLADDGFVRERGLNGYRLLDRGDPSQVVYSVVIHERTDGGNFIRVETDNLDTPFNLNESARLELGSTAKLRTLASYLNVVAELHERFSELQADSLRAITISDNDPLARWARGQILLFPAIELQELLRRSLARTYSANPSTRFVTGGGVQTFSNFDSTYDQRSITVSEAFQQSVNLVFVRMMRDIVNYYVYRQPGSAAHVLDDPESPLRNEYLQRFADREGTQFINQFMRKFEDRGRSEILRALIQDRRLSPQRTAWAYRSAAPNASPAEFEELLRSSQTDLALAPGTIQDLFERADPLIWDLADLGYLASVHPLELWLARYLIEHPEADRAEILRESAQARQDVYRWLFRTSRQSAQDQRIRFLLEVEAFTEILAGWRALGYPFSNIVPSLGTSIGSSGDRPAALGELVGIIVNDGVRVPAYRVQELHFARGTPFETRMVRGPASGERVMRPEVARTLREAMVGVVERGTARRISGVLRGPDGEPLVVGGKTGTGDNRYRTFGPGGRQVESRSVNRTSTFVFFVEDRLYGVVTAYVPGEAADDYWFTSALPTQILRELAPVLEDLMRADPVPSSSAVVSDADGAGGVAPAVESNRSADTQVEEASRAEASGQL